MAAILNDTRGADGAGVGRRRSSYGRGIKEAQKSSIDTDIEIVGSDLRRTGTQLGAE